MNPDFIGLARAVARLTNALADLEAINAKQAARIAELEAAEPSDS